MKVMVQEVENEGLMTLLGKNVMVQTGIYIYAGKLVGVNDTCIKLENTHVVFETGEFTLKKFKDAQKCAQSVHYIMHQALISVSETSQI